MFCEIEPICVSEIRSVTSKIKASGYRSYHAIVEYPVDTINETVILSEIRIRTLSMNFWATIELFKL